ncbi:glycosyltransferase family A protein [Saccharicrinis sp. FJH2]|uniref:glycosyltransferase family A protein n=1 Tax=Saccharicrinis sp. FJH65 TaxID=3344659 RepID=UPI0035F49355
MPDRYVIITSVYNEAEHITRTLDSVLKQTILPVTWIIVDDGSTDNTLKILSGYSEKHDFVKIISSQKSQVEFGAHVAYNFDIGLNSVEDDSYDFLVKLDGDLDIDDITFFEYQLKKFEHLPKLGISSGLTYSVVDGKKILTSSRPYWRTGGAMKVYRKECFEQIGGIQPIYGWDGLDEYLAMYYGWKTRTFFNLHVNHLGKKRALAREGQKDLFYKKGESYYKRGYPVEFLILKVLKLSLKNRIFGMALYKGYLNSKVSGNMQLVDKNQKKFIRKIQYMRVLDKFTSKELL